MVCTDLAHQHRRRRLPGASLLACMSDLRALADCNMHCVGHQSVRWLCTYLHCLTSAHLNCAGADRGQDTPRSGSTGQPASPRISRNRLNGRRPACCSLQQICGRMPHQCRLQPAIGAGTIPTAAGLRPAALLGVVPAHAEGCQLHPRLCALHIVWWSLARTIQHRHLCKHGWVHLGNAAAVMR
jgi:hypothetical protein